MLERRFGESYREYRRNVPRFLPRLRPWSRELRPGRALPNAGIVGQTAIADASMATDRDPIRRDSFDSVAEAYDRGRPSYPEPLVDDLITLANIGEGSTVLEIGPGTGNSACRWQ